MAPAPLTAAEISRRTEDICRAAPIVPVLIVEDVAHARPLAEALVAGGLPALEVTLRTPAALEVISEMAKVPGGIPGAGTLLTPDDVKRARDAGARFGVSPGASEALLEAAEAEGLPLLPGAATATEAMALLARGYTVLKFFPAEAAGGAAFLKALASPLPQIRFCPTGGISPTNAEAYLSLPNVLCAGGSWVAPKALMEAGDWAEITRLAREAAALPRG
ncbi:MAG: bifunctional 4-hydroxy-2-oxoglutarate aldolase/2-dehydro-3-deoxy-phosphogluconate aldolase [Alphaproteobacteria bacterium]|nr:MAG: bifunctional 4-hydroxy-2-oxoglutarate aldolase/2-dehydro-3-deoxy-phosphogluconate aldolase [Alphaproteobacteria bacterium]